MPARELELTLPPAAVVDQVGAALGRSGFRFSAVGAEGEYIYQLGTWFTMVLTGAMGLAAGPLARAGTAVLSVAPTAGGCRVQLALVHGEYVSAEFLAIIGGLVREWDDAGVVVSAGAAIASHELPESSLANMRTYRRRKSELRNA